MPVLGNEEDVESSLSDVGRLLTTPVTVSLPVAVIVVVKLFSTTGGMSGSLSSGLVVAILEALAIREMMGVGGRAIRKRGQIASGTGMYRAGDPQRVE